MSTWRYVAIPIDAAAPTRAKRTGEMSGTTAADVRASLRRIGFRVVRMQEVRANPRRDSGGAGGAGAETGLLVTLRARLHGYASARRREKRAELYDGLATMLASGVPLLEAVDTLLMTTRDARRSSLRLMLVELKEALRSGSALSDAMGGMPSWFEPSEIAIVAAGERSGTLESVLRGLSERHQSSGELTNRLTGALAYPFLVTLVGIAVVIFLSVGTLPELVGVLDDSGIEAPALTLHVMSFGQTIASHGLTIVVVAAVSLGALLLTSTALASRGWQPPRWMTRLRPRVVRRIAVARFSLQLGEMLRSGVPMADAIRVLAPTSGGSFRNLLTNAAARLERGDEFAHAFGDDIWFDAEYRRLLDVGQATGELDQLLDRIGQRYARQARRLIDRLTSLLEPAVILVLAALVGVVVMAAVLPLLRLQEII